ncbi:hypothetical protein CBR_g38030 [Chara braunii]|uniref:Uncharacterized protein n=1 Tax=Chara braunii TaxID=69332 RepID=A0A388K052_CHABU|nr:hypothetical protein CBR_g38030 [Chara braunii]|eukprot:GBG63407.1 hypothetical protein CBR_g38030 [Chara braunii]
MNSWFSKVSALAPSHDQPWHCRTISLGTVAFNREGIKGRLQVTEGTLPERWGEETEGVNGLRSYDLFVEQQNTAKVVECLG